MQAPTVYIVTVSHNRRMSTRAFCESLCKQTYRQFVLILVDDGSTDGTCEMVQEFSFPAEICHGNGNLWWAGGVRRGLSRLRALNPAPSDVVFIVNDDTTFDEGFLARAVEEIAHSGSGVMLCASVHFTDSKGYTDGGTVCSWHRLTFKHYGAHPERIDCASTRCIFFLIKDMAMAGTFRPGMLPHYLSDYEFTLRAHRHGMRLLPAKSVVCFATEHTTGNHYLEPGPLRTVVAQMMSPRFSANPASLFMFVYLAAPLLWRPVCWFWALRTATGFLLKAAITDRLQSYASRERTVQN